jgi:lactate dehydrogenase-like 2-hydroxyacid dehydrogenase
MENSGIIGTGKIGAALQNHARFWLQILACDPEQNPELIQQIDISYYTRRGLCYFR